MDVSEHLSGMSPGFTSSQAVTSAQQRVQLFRRAGLQSERVQLAAHLAAQRFIYKLVLLNPGFAPEAFGQDGSRIVVAVAGEVPDGHLRVRNMALDELLGRC